jgi:filamentous hemagglutinin family protein
MRTPVIFLLVLFGSQVQALPVNGIVVAGSAHVAVSGSNTVITQSSQNAVLNWQNFSIAQGESVRFVQPNSSSVALNQVLGSDPSNIFGSLSANGKVFLVNPNGILFGQGATVNVGGLVASTVRISNTDFMASNYQFSGAGNGSVINQGDIRTNVDGGYVALLGANVSNQGVIAAKLGTIVLAAGNAMTLDVAGDGLLNVTVNAGTVNALVQNGGLIQADGGQVVLTTQVAGSLLSNAVNNTGIIEAQTIEQHEGRILLLGGMGNGTVTVGGTLDASAPNRGDGGFIETSASHVNIADGIHVTTESTSGKTGTWLIDPVDFTIAVAGGDITGLTLAHNLLASNITISNNDGLTGIQGDIHVNTPVHWAGATALTLNAVHDIFVDAAITADTAGAMLKLIAGHDIATLSPITTVAAGSLIDIGASNDVRMGGAITMIAANSAINISSGQNLSTTAPIHTVAADSAIAIYAGLDINIGGAVTATAANSAMTITAGRDATTSAAITAVAASSSIRMLAGRDATNTVTGAISVGAATSIVELSAGRNVNVNAAIAASAAGSSIHLLAGLGGISGNGPGVTNGTVNIVGAVASPNVTIRFNPNGYANTNAEIALYPALSDAKAWVYVQGKNKNYDGTKVASLVFNGTPTSAGEIFLLPGNSAFVTKDAGIGKSILFEHYGLGGKDSGKFSLFAASGTTTADITTRPLMVSANANTRTYTGDTSGSVVLNDNRIAGDVLVLSYAMAEFVDKNVGNGKQVNVSGINLSGTDAGNYAVASTVTTSANITPAPLSITAADAWKYYGQTPDLLAFSAVGLVNGEVIGHVPQNSLGALTNAGVAGAPYVITPCCATGVAFSASNYFIRYVNGSLVVVPVGLTITASDYTKVFGETLMPRGFTVFGLVNDETIDAVLETSAGSAVTADVAGSPYPITPGKALGENFNAANYSIEYINGELTVLPIPIIYKGLLS